MEGKSIVCSSGEHILFISATTCHWGFAAASFVASRMNCVHWMRSGSFDCFMLNDKETTFTILFLVLKHVWPPAIPAIPAAFLWISTCFGSSCARIMKICLIFIYSSADRACLHVALIGQGPLCERSSEVRSLVLCHMLPLIRAHTPHSLILFTFNDSLCFTQTRALRRQQSYYAGVPLGFWANGKYHVTD